MAIEHRFNALVVGNGFDLHLKLKTKYENFHKIMKDVFDATVRDSGPYTKRWNNEGYENDEKRGSSELFYKIFDNKNNFFIKYFSKAKHEEWNQLEKELEKIYLSFDLLLESLSSYNIHPDYYTINNVYNFPTIHIFDYIDEWRDFKFIISSVAKGQAEVYDMYLNTNTISYIDRIDRIKKIKVDIPKLLYEDLILFCDIFTLYLNAFANFSEEKKAKIFANYIFSYNYTDIAERIISPIKTLYLHGKLDYVDFVPVNGWRGSQIVLGIDDKVSFKNLGFDRFKKTIIRSMFDSDIHNLNYYLERACDNSNIDNTIAIIGHSLDLIDEDSLKIILSRKYSKYYVYYYNDEAKFYLIYNLRKILGVDKYKELFNSDSIKYIPISNLNLI